jgi:putative ABC transport system permease protein
MIEHINQTAMFRNYFKVSMRGLMKNPTSSFINVFGLSAAIGICVFAYAFARWTYSTDQFHEHRNSVFLVTFFADRDGAPQQYGLTPRPLGEMLRSDFSNIRKVCRVEDRPVIVKHGDNVFHERIRYTDPEFLEMFTFPLKWGTPGSLKDVNSIILNEKMSVKYFGDENPIGRSILVKFDQHNSKAFKIAGVAAEFPKARTIQFDFLINFENLRTAEPGYDFHDWNKFVYATLVQVQDPTDIRTVEERMEKYRKLQNQAVHEDWAISSFAFEPLATLHRRSEHIRDDISRSAADNYSSIVYLTCVSVFLLVLACFNYVNIAIVSAAKRLKEIGVRKSIGATRRVVIIQFLSENIVITFFALTLGVVLAMTVFVPGFERLFNFSMDFRLTHASLWIFLAAILLFTSMASGMYPSLYISKFQVVGILKGAVRFGKKNPVTKTFLGFQLVLACVFIITAVMFTQNSVYMLNRSWGYDPDAILYTRVPDYASYEQLSAVMGRLPDVSSLSGSAHHLGKNNATTVLHFPDREYEVDYIAVDANYFETMGLELRRGRVFRDHEGSGRQSVVVNEMLVENMGWNDPLGQQFRIDSVEYQIIGVVRDFHSYSFFTPLRPTIITVSPKKDYRYLSMKVSKSSKHETFRTLQAKWSELFPEIPFEGGYQEDVWGFYHEEIRIHSLVWRIFAFIAVTLAGLGLYGLITLNVAGRAKEFSVRKVLGAGLKNIAASITNQYVVLPSIAALWRSRRPLPEQVRDRDRLRLPYARRPLRCHHGRGHHDARVTPDCFDAGCKGFQGKSGGGVEGGVMYFCIIDVARCDQGVFGEKSLLSLKEAVSCRPIRLMMWMLWQMQSLHPIPVCHRREKTTLIIGKIFQEFFGK